MSARLQGVIGEGLRMAFAGVEVVKGVDLELRPGEVHAILGENGAGKSTVAKLFAGVYRPTAGQVSLIRESGHEKVQLHNPRHAISLGIALIHQEPLTFPDLDVAENIFVGHQPSSRAGVDWRQMRTRAREILESLDVKLDARAQVGSLSVADQQMVELAAALSHDARVLLFDETTASLTPKEVQDLFRIIRRLRSDGCALAFVSHRLEEVFELCDRITVMRDGSKVAELRPPETSIPEVVRLMVGRAGSGEEGSARAVGKMGADESPDSGWPQILSTEPPIGTAPPAPATASVPPAHNFPPAIAVHNLSVSRRVHGVSFEVRPGEIVGMAGLIGSGRTEVAQAIFGVRQPSAGTIEVNGRPVRIRSPRHAMRLAIVMVPEDRQHEGLLMPLPIAENTALPILRTFASLGWVRAKRVKGAAIEEATRLRLNYRSVSQAVQELSGGNQQKVVIGKWLLAKPRLLILDEPTRGVDVGAKAEVHRLIRELAAQGLAVLMISSDLPEVLELSERVLVMREGSLVADLSQPTSEQVMRAATGTEP